jgi:hypothetical protein
MTTTQPVWWRPRPVALDVLLALREAQSRDLLRQLVEPRDPRSSRHRRVAGSTVAAGLGAISCVLAVLALYVLIVSGLGVPVSAGSFGG